MTASKSLSSVPTKSVSHNRHRNGATQMSWSKVFEPRSFRAGFAKRWSTFLRNNYNTPEEVAVNYGVRFQTALNWWDAANRPSGDVVALAFTQKPNEIMAALSGGQE